MTKTLFIRIALTIILLSLAWIILTPVIIPVNTSQAEIAAPHKGFIAPDLTLSTPNGQLLSLSEYRSKTVLIFFWASWCSVCKKTMPAIQLVYEDYKTKGFEVFAINTTNQDTISKAVNTFTTMGYDFKLLLDIDGTIANDYRVFALPTAILVNADEIVQDVVIGSGLSEGYLRAILDQLFRDGN